MEEIPSWYSRYRSIHVVLYIPGGDRQQAERSCGCELTAESDRTCEFSWNSTCAWEAHQANNTTKIPHKPGICDSLVGNPPNISILIEKQLGHQGFKEYIYIYIIVSPSMLEAYYSNKSSKYFDLYKSHEGSLKIRDLWNASKLGESFEVEKIHEFGEGPGPIDLGAHGIILRHDFPEANWCKV